MTETFKNILILALIGIGLVLALLTGYFAGLSSLTKKIIDTFDEEEKSDEKPDDQ